MTYWRRSDQPPGRVCGRQPGAPGWSPQPPAVEFTRVRGAGLPTTVPPSVVPWAEHSQYPSMGMVVMQVNGPAWQMFAAKAGPGSADAARSAKVRYPMHRILRGPPSHERRQHRCRTPGRVVREVVEPGRSGGTPVPLRFLPQLV